MAILTVKKTFLGDTGKRDKARKHHEALLKVMTAEDVNHHDLDKLVEINTLLWLLEDEVRKNPNLLDYMTITRWNDKRAAVKKQIDEKAGSEIREVKSYI